MTSSKMTTTLKDEVLNLMRGGASITYDVAGNLLALTTDVPVGETYTKVANFGYSDVLTTSLDFAPPSNLTGNNATELVFPEVDNASDVAAIAYSVRGAVIERATDGQALYTQGITNGYSYRHGDEASFPVGNIRFSFNYHSDRIGVDLVNSLYNSTLRGQTLNSVGVMHLEFLANVPTVNSTDVVLSIPPIEVTSADGSWTAPASATTYRTAAELKDLSIPEGARAIVNATELRSQTLEQQYNSVAGLRLVTPTGEVWWRVPIAPAKLVYEDAQLKILPQTILLAI